MKTLDHAFNVDGLRKCGRKWRTMLKSVPTLGNVWLRANIIKNGCAQKQYGRCRVCPKT